MNANLKSLKEFEKEVDCLTNEQLKQLSGGRIDRWVERTNENGIADKSYMAAEYRWNGYEWVLRGVPYQESICYIYPGDTP